MHDENPDWENDHCIAACEGIWREHNKEDLCAANQSSLAAIMARLERVKNLLLGKFGTLGQAFYDATLVRLGVYDPKSQKFNSGLIKSEIKLPFVKSESPTEFTIGNMCLGMGDFTKVDEQEHTVSGYANTCVADCAGDVVFPEAYRNSVSKYGKSIFFMHHTDIQAGDLIESKVDEMGWYVKTHPLSTFWPMIQNKTLKGFSIGGWFKGAGQQHGNAIVWTYDVDVDDLSYVNKPCNKLAFFDFIKSESSKMTDGHDVNVVKFKKQEIRKMPDETQTNVANTNAEKKEEPSIDEQITKLLAKKEEEAKLKILRALERKDAEDQVAKKDERLTTLEQKFGSLETKINEFMGKFESHEARLAKVESTPERTATSTASAVVDPIEIIAAEHSLGAMMDKAAELAEPKKAEP